MASGGVIRSRLAIERRAPGQARIRVAFVDGQNPFHAAHEAFGYTYPPTTTWRSSLARTRISRRLPGESKRLQQFFPSLQVRKLHRFLFPLRRVNSRGPTPSPRVRASSRISRVHPPNSTRRRRLVFGRLAGTVHTLPLRSISSHSAHRTSPPWLPSAPGTRRPASRPAMPSIPSPFG